jgi:hypothetical protein
MTVIINGTDNSASTPAVTGTDGDTGMFYPAANTVALSTGGSERMRVDSSGNVGIGTTSPGVNLDIKGPSTSSQIRFTGNGSVINRLYGDNDGIVILSADVNNATAGSFMAFQVDGTERARISPEGYFKASDAGAYGGGIYHELRSTAAAAETVLILSNNDSFSSEVVIAAAIRNTSNNSYYFYRGAVAGVGTRFLVADSGNVTNTNNSYGSISDVKLKQDIVDASSQWDDIKNLRVRKYHWKSDPDGFMQMGLVAQEAELVSPGLIEEHSDYEEVEVTDEEGNVTKQRNALGTTTKAVKYSVLYMKAVKALQEAMERIETLEAKVAALEGAE